ncbi:unnamed protein product [Schistocephalus solidus]|uniref:Thioredoxin n=1 Tax=Schistocephalus solidus TaxID=70667 RepID=A0A183T6W7_SCHSO|nr:unnamed protein product [Schistocephalus solidus]
MSQEQEEPELAPLVTEINSEEDMDELKKISQERLVIVDFFATWCGPCKSVKAAYEKLAEEETSVTFAKLDIDVYEAGLEDAPSDYSLVAMPTFMAFKNGEMVDSVIGPHIDALRQMIDRLK